MSRRLSVRTKLSYGLGSIGEGLFSRGYEFFVYFYFVQILGMSATLGGLAMLISTVLDAVTDPLIGSISDNWKSRLGRRHPFMYASAVPFALTWFLLLSPPAGLSSFQLFLWFTAFSILLRQALTLYHVPHLALGAELTDDYIERTSVATWSIGCGFIGSFGMVALFTAVLFPETAAYPKNGLLNPAGYPVLALCGATLMLLSIGYSAWGTRDQIPHLPAAPAVAKRISARELLHEVGIAWKNPSFRALFVGSFLFVVSFSILEIFNPFLRIYFWELTSGQIAGLILPAAVGFIGAVILAPILHRRFDKKPTVIVSSIIPGTLTGGLVILQMLGWLPASKAFVITALGFASFLGGVCGGVAFISSRSMMADVAQEIAYTSGRSVTGILFAGISFSQKVSSSVGHFFAGLALDLIRIPAGAEPGTLPQHIVNWLGVASLSAAFFSALGIACYFGYRIDRTRHAELGLAGGPAIPSTGHAATPQRDTAPVVPRGVSVES